jgi:hypothetical protein
VQLLASEFMSEFMLMPASIGCTLKNGRSTEARGRTRFTIEGSHTCSVHGRPPSWSPPTGGQSVAATVPVPESFGYCADVATYSVWILNFKTANCAAVPDPLLAASSTTVGNALPSAVE